MKRQRSPNIVKMDNWRAVSRKSGEDKIWEGELRFVLNSTPIFEGESNYRALSFWFKVRPPLQHLRHNVITVVENSLRNCKGTRQRCNLTNFIPYYHNCHYVYQNWWYFLIISDHWKIKQLRKQIWRTRDKFRPLWISICRATYYIIETCIIKISKWNLIKINVMTTNTGISCNTQTFDHFK